MIGNGERVGRRLRVATAMFTRAALLAFVAAVPLAGAGAQSQPPRLEVYSDDLSTGGSAASGSVQRGTSIAVDIDVLEEFEARTTALEERMQAHVDDGDAHLPHGHPAHRHSGGPSSVPTADARGGHEPLRELVAQLIELLVPFAEAQVQPPPLVVYDSDMSGPSSTAPTTSRTDLEVVLDVDIPLVDTVRALIARLGRELTVHIAARPGHAHGHPHSH